MTVNIITVGKLKEKYWRDACEEYLKRLSPFGKISVTELAEARLPAEPTDGETANALAQEAKSMERYLSAKNTVNIAMCIEGDELDSVSLAKKLEKYSVGGCSTINFFVGSSFGLDDSIKKKCSMRLSMSPMTFPHQLARVMLLEQLYRAFSINANSKYHK